MAETKDIDPKLGEDVGKAGSLHMVAVPDAEITRQRVIDYAQAGVLLIPAHLAVRVPSVANPNYAGDHVTVCKRCGIHSIDFAAVPCCKRQSR